MHTGSVEVWTRSDQIVVAFHPGNTTVFRVDTAREFVRALTAAVNEATRRTADHR